MRVILLFLMMLLAGICHADNHWMKMKTQGDKVEQIPPEVVYNYEDELAQLNIFTSKRMIALNPINQFAWDSIGMRGQCQQSMPLCLLLRHSI